MKAWLKQRLVRKSPLRVWLLVIAVVSVTEAAVMLVLPSVLPEHPSLFLEAAVDSILLTVLISPLLWWFIERPLRDANNMRAAFMVEYLARTEAERRHIAHDLHDGVGQWLTLMVSGLKSAEAVVADPECSRRLVELQQLARNALQDVKRLALGLRPSLLDDLGLKPALERIVADICEHHPIEFTLDTNELADRRLPEAVETAVFRIAQESLSNIVKHSRAKRASMTVRFGNGAVQLEVRDDGVGISDQFLRGGNSGNGKHLGLIGMRERASLLGGEMTVESNPGHGTILLVRIPSVERS